MVKIQDIRYFQAIAKHGTLQLASKELHVSQPALSHALKRLEEEFELQFFERSKKGVLLTKAGKQLLSRTDALLADWDNISRDLQTSSKQIKGICNFGCHISVALYSFEKFVPELVTKYPDLEFRFTHDLSRNINKLIIDSSLDIGIVVNPDPHPDLIIRPLFEDEISLWQTRGNKNKTTLILDPSLAQTSWITRKMNRSAFTRRIESGSLEIVRALTNAGAGVGILPARVAANTDTKLEKLSGYPNYSDKICLAYKPHFAKSGFGRIIIDSIMDKCAEK